jgi:hypothetical protein
VNIIVSPSLDTVKHSSAEFILNIGIGIKVTPYGDNRINVMKLSVKSNGDAIQSAEKTEYHGIRLTSVLNVTVKHYESQEEKEHHIHSEIKNGITDIGYFVMSGHCDTTVSYKRKKSTHQKADDIPLIGRIIFDDQIYTCSIQYHEDTEQDHKSI